MWWSVNEPMQIFDRLEQVSLEGESVLAIGSFDGIHLGHQHLIKVLVQRARISARLAGVLTFHPHPRAVLWPENTFGCLTSPEEKIALLQDLELDFLVNMTFTLELARTPARVFIQEVSHHLRMRELLCGPDFTLGWGKEGDVPFLREMGKELGFTVYVVGPFTLGEEVVSSTSIRSFLAKGQVERAAEFLGRYPKLKAPVIPGAGRGHGLGFPTANLLADERKMLPGDGVYAVRVHLKGLTFDGVASIGRRPSFDGGERTVEVHILDFDDDIYGKELEMEFVKRLRAERRFHDVRQLIAQIHQDMGRARQILNS